MLYRVELRVGEDSSGTVFIGGQEANGGLVPDEHEPVHRKGTEHGQSQPPKQHRCSFRSADFEGCSGEGHKSRETNFTTPVYAFFLSFPEPTFACFGACRSPRA